MLGTRITDRFKSESKDTESLEGMGFIDIETDYLKEKNTYQVEFELEDRSRDEFNLYFSGSGGPDEGGSRTEKMKGYEIHMGVSKVIGSGNGLMSLFNINRRGNEETELEDGILKLDSENKKMVIGTYIHGVFDNYIFRRSIIRTLKAFNNIKSGSGKSSIRSYNDFKQDIIDIICLKEINKVIKSTIMIKERNMENKDNSKEGLVIINTGGGKGKTTAALGLALRAAGHGQKVLILQFIKGAWKTGEAKIMERLRNRDGAVGEGLYKICRRQATDNGKG